MPSTRPGQGDRVHCFAKVASKRYLCCPPATSPWPSELLTSQRQAAEGQSAQAQAPDERFHGSEGKGGGGGNDRGGDSGSGGGRSRAKQGANNG